MVSLSGCGVIWLCIVGLSLSLSLSLYVSLSLKLCLCLFVHSSSNLHGLSHIAMHPESFSFLLTAQPESLGPSSLWIARCRFPVGPGYRSIAGPLNMGASVFGMGIPVHGAIKCIVGTLKTEYISEYITCLYIDQCV